MIIRAAIYARTSPDCPISSEDQVERLTMIAEERGWTIVHKYTDRPMTVQAGQDRRPGETALIDAVRSGMIDKVLIWSVCRIGKSLIELVNFMETCRAA